MEQDFDRLKRSLADRYVVERQIGQGGMATVYLATESQHGRPVAIKVLDSTLGDLLGRQRFVREVELVSRLSHPNIVPIFAAGEADGLLYYVMPFIEGFTVRHRLIRDGTMSPREALRVGRDVAGALAHAHERGVVHRDIKPENILLSDSRPVVADFGIAKALLTAGGDTLTQTGLIIGTPRYMSPEQADGGTVDGRADIFALGRVLFEMILGDIPPNDPRALADRTAALDPSVADIFRRALANDVGARFPDARGLEMALDDAAGSLTGGGRAPGPRTIPVRTVAIGALVALLLLFLVLVALAVF